MTMIIITWLQTSKARGGADSYRMRLVTKQPVRPDAPFVVERAYEDAAGGSGWVPAKHEHATAILCLGLLQCALRGDPVPREIDLGALELPPTIV